MRVEIVGAVGCGQLKTCAQPVHVQRSGECGVRMMLSGTMVERDDDAERDVGWMENCGRHDVVCDLVLRAWRVPAICALTSNVPPHVLRNIRSRRPE